MSLILMRRYAFDTTIAVGSVYVIFLLIFFAYESIIGKSADFDRSIKALTVSFMVFSYAVSQFDQLASTLYQEALQGTLEQVALSPFGLLSVLICRVVSHSLITLVVILALLHLMMATTGIWLELRLGYLIPLLLAINMGVTGVGFALGGLALIFKRVASTFALLNCGFMVLTVMPETKTPWVTVLPVAWGSAMIRRLTEAGPDALEARDVLILVANSVIWATLGVVVFRCMETIAARNGSLHHS